MIEECERTSEQHQTRPASTSLNGPQRNLVRSTSGGERTRALEIAEHNNIRTEPSGIAGLALFLDRAPLIPRNEKVVIVNTGWLYLP